MLYRSPVRGCSLVAVTILVHSVAGEVARECNMPGREYQASRVCSAEVRQKWRQLAEQPVTVPQQDGCRFDHSSGKIICDNRMSCEGGFSHPVESFQHRHAMDYDCSECPGSSRGSCCRKCAELRDQARGGNLEVGSNRIYEVYCNHCTDITASPTAVQCAHDPIDGQFKCSVSEKCEPGQPKINSQNMSYTCVVTPCETCTNDVLKAQCCYSCLNHFCGADLSFDTRKVCRGCDEPGVVPRYEPPANCDHKQYEPPPVVEQATPTLAEDIRKDGIIHGVGHWINDHLPGHHEAAAKEPYIEPYKPPEEPEPAYEMPTYGGPPPAQDWWSIRQALEWHSGYRGDTP